MAVGSTLRTSYKLPLTVPTAVDSSAVYETADGHGFRLFRPEYRAEFGERAILGGDWGEKITGGIVGMFKVAYMIESKEK